MLAAIDIAAPVLGMRLMTVVVMTMSEREGRVLERIKVHKIVVGRLMWILSTLLGLMLMSANSRAEEVSFLPVNEAFAIDADRTDSAMNVRWAIAEGYYLYLSRISVVSEDQALTTGPVEYLTQAEEKEDPYFGLQRIFHNEASLQFTVIDNRKGEPDEGEGVVIVSYQGCAEAGLCYPPQKRMFKWSELSHLNTSAPSASVSSTSAPRATAPETIATKTTDLKTIGDTTAENADSRLQTAQKKSATGGIADFLASSGFWAIVATFFVLGLGLTFTPCVLPMVPILSSIIAGQKGEMTTARGFMLSSAYVLGMASTYTLLGVLVGFFGAKANLQAWMQQPFVLSLFAVLFVLLAFSMFGFYELQVPAALRDKLDNFSRKQKGGELVGVTLMGVISALVVSPCVSAPLAGALLYISSTGDAVLGGTALFALSLGMGAPLIAIGSTGARLLPKAGAWMDKVKQVFGIIMLAVALWLLQRILNEQINGLLWAMLFIGAGIHLGALQSSVTGGQKAAQTIGLSFVLWGALILIGVALGAPSITAPLKDVVSSKGVLLTENVPSAGIEFEHVTTVAQLEESLSRGEPVIVDVYADWCVSCIEMEETIFSQSATLSNAGAFHFVQWDVTAFSDEHKSMMDQLGIVGPPAILFFNEEGKEMTSHRVAGEVTLIEFLDVLKAANLNI